MTLPAPSAVLVILDGWGIAPPGPGNAVDHDRELTGFHDVEQRAGLALGDDRLATDDVLPGGPRGHPLELVLAFPVGRAAGFSAGRTVLKTILFGFTWWVPVSLKVFRQKG